MDWKVPGGRQQELKASSPEKSGFERSSLGGIQVPKNWACLCAWCAC